MKLIGKSKEVFEKWYSFNVYSETHHILGLKEFYNLPFSMQYGVLVDFFDSVGICIFMTDDYDYDYETNTTIKTFIPVVGGCKVNTWESYKTRSQAREQAITKAVEILNNRK